MGDGYLIKAVADKAGISDFDADYAVTAFLQTLGQRIGSLQIEAISRQLPARWSDALRDYADQPRDYTADEFLDQFSERQGMTADSSLPHAKAVWEMLNKCIDSTEMDEVRSALSADYEEIFEPASR